MRLFTQRRNDLVLFTFRLLLTLNFFQMNIIYSQTSRKDFFYSLHTTPFFNAMCFQHHKFLKIETREHVQANVHLI